MKKQKPQDQQPEPARRQQRNNVRATVRVLVVCYLGWLIFKLISGYHTGESGMSLTTVVVAVVAFSAALIAIVVVSYRQWRREDTRVRHLWAEEGEREEAALREEDDHE